MMNTYCAALLLCVLFLYGQKPISKFSANASNSDLVSLSFVLNNAGFYNCEFFADYWDGMSPSLKIYDFKETMDNDYRFAFSICIFDVTDLYIIDIKESCIPEEKVILNLG